MEQTTKGARGQCSNRRRGHLIEVSWYPCFGNSQRFFGPPSVTDVIRNQQRQCIRQVLSDSLTGQCHKADLQSEERRGRPRTIMVQWIIEGEK